VQSIRLPLSPHGTRIGIIGRSSGTGTKCFLVLLVILAASLPACSSSGSNDGGTDGIVWNYQSGPNGPANWANLSPDFAACGTGSEQSPIDITVDPIDDVSALEPNYHEVSLDLEHSGHSLVVNARFGGSIALGQVNYDLKYLEFHVPGEHRYKGSSFAGEIHLFHESADGHVIVVAVWMTEGVLNKTLSTIEASAPGVLGEHVEDDSILLNPEDLLPELKPFYRYDGSLSQPPCTEGVTWLVLRNSIEVGENQINFLRNLYGENSRPLQALNGRTISQG